MSSWQTLSKVQYLMSHTPADDRVGRGTSSAPVERLRHHVTGAIDRGQAQPIVEIPAEHVRRPIDLTNEFPGDTPAPAQSRRYVQCPECESSFRADTLPVHTFNGSRCPGSPAPAEPARLAPDVDAAELDTSETGRPIGKRFVLAGKAIVTLVGRESRYTFQINRKDPEPGSQYTRPAYFVSLLTGQDNTSDYTYVGMLDDRTGTVRLTRKSTYRDDSAPVKAFNWIMARVWRDLPLPAPAKLLHAGRCGRCGRLLTVPSSVESGFGPECIGKV